MNLLKLRQLVPKQSHFANMLILWIGNWTSINISIDDIVLSDWHPQLLLICMTDFLSHHSETGNPFCQYLSATQSSKIKGNG